MCPYIPAQCPLYPGLSTLLSYTSWHQLDPDGIHLKCSSNPRRCFAWEEPLGRVTHPHTRWLILGLHLGAPELAAQQGLELLPGAPGPQHGLGLGCVPQGLRGTAGSSDMGLPNTWAPAGMGLPHTWALTCLVVSPYILCQA